jgi:hypothetical protein
MGSNESPANPTWAITDIAAAAEIAHEHVVRPLGEMGDHDALRPRGAHQQGSDQHSDGDDCEAGVGVAAVSACAKLIKRAPLAIGTHARA